MTHVLDNMVQPDLRGAESEQSAIKLRCPVCKRKIGNDLECKSCKFVMIETGGIIHALPPDRLAYYSDFVADYEHIRAAEGRGSHEKNYYVSLPYKDVTGLHIAQWKVRARSFDYLIDRVIKSTAKRAVVLDLGAGNCWLSYQLIRLGYRAVAVDLLTNSQDGLGAAEHYHQDLGSPIPRFQAELNCLPFQDEQFDVAIFNASFHYSEDYKATLREALRCIKPNGIVVIADTPWYEREQSGKQMIAERRTHFQSSFQTASDSLETQEFLTNNRLTSLADALSIQWTVHHPWYGLRWAMRPWIAKLHRRREPSRFRIYVARKDAR